MDWNDNDIDWDEVLSRSVVILFILLLGAIVIVAWKLALAMPIS